MIVTIISVNSKPELSLTYFNDGIFNSNPYNMSRLDIVQNSRKDI